MKKEQQPTISVIVPVYNSENYIHDCIDSLINQTYHNLEILLIDDGSTDSSGDICDEYAQKDSRIKVIHKQNSGQSGARNLGMTSAIGDYIGFVDSDDTIESDMYECLLEACLMYDSDIAVCARYNVNEVTKEKTKLFTLPMIQTWQRHEAIKRFLTWDCIDASPCDKLFSKSVLDNVEYPLGYISEDVPFIYQVLKQADRITHIGTPKYNYLQRSGSTSCSKISHKTIGVVKYPFEIRNDILQSFPDLTEHADYFYFSRELIYIRQLLNEGYTADAKDRIIRIRDSGWRLVWNKNFNWIERICIFLINIHAFKVFYRVFKVLRGKK